MKLTDLALIFIGVTLPVIIIVYVNVSFTIKAQEQEMYYKKIISAAVQDAANQMKEVENDDKSIDYGYSGLEDKKVSINAQIAKETFFKTLYNSLGITGNEAAERYLQTFVPCLAIIDYNGVYISSEETYTKSGEKVTEHVVKPKKYYTYSYYIVKESGNYKMVDVDSYTSGDGNIESTHTVEFTMDDYITHRGMKGNTSFDAESIPTKTFYITDSKNNSDLTNSVTDSSIQCPDGKNGVARYLASIREQVIIDTLTNQIAYATNAANSYARSAGVTYDFVFPVLDQDEMESAIDNVGVFAFVQGLNIGNKYLNAKSYSISKLESAVRYYFTIPDDGVSKVNLNLYHNNLNCPEYKVSDNDNLTPAYVITKQQAASAQVSRQKTGEKPGQDVYEGFYPCPICNP